MQNLAELTKRLIEARVDFVLVGGFAAMAHGVLRSTRDVVKNLYLKTDLGILDCLGEIKAVAGYDEVLKRSVELDLPIGKCRVIDIDMLIAAKEAMGRDHDRVTVKELKQIKNRRQQN